MSKSSKDHAEAGNKYVADTSATTYSYYGFTIVSDAVISAITADASQDVASITGDTLPKGLYLPISGSAITLTSGAVLLHKKYS